MNCRTKKRELDLLYSAIQQTISRTYSTPQLAAQVLDLYAGNEFPKIDPDTHFSMGPDCHNDPLKFQYDVDVGRIEEIFALNSSSIPDIGGHPDGAPVALFLLPSYINHSCIPSTHCVYHGDVMIIRAGENIPKGKEITRRYAWSPSFYYRGRGLSKYFDECDCKLCEEERAEDQELRATRDRLLQDLIQTPREVLTVTMAQYMVKEIQLTYPTSRRTFRPGMAYAYNRHADALLDYCNDLKQGDEQYKRIIKANISFLEASGVTVLDKGMSASPRHRASFREAIGYHHMPISDKEMTYDPQGGRAACLSIASCFCALGVRSRVEMWLRATIWSMCI